ncbi:MAG: hypothetical protein ACI9O6_001898 [Glaciecola sp.]|jgi:hypothetical protein
MVRYLIILFFLSFLSLSSTAQELSSTSQEAQATESRFEVGEELIVTVRIGKYKFSEILITKSNTGYQTELDALFEVLEFPIEQVGSGYAYEGWYLKDSNLFLLSNSENSNEFTVQTTDKSFQLNQDNYSIVDGLLQVEIDEVGRWFGISFSVDETNQSLLISADYQFPFEVRLARESRTIRDRASPYPVMPYRRSSVELLSGQALDIQINSNFSENINSTGYSVLGSRDIALLETRFFVAGNDQNGLTDARFTAGRSSQAKGLLGPLNASRFQFGDVTPVRLGSRSISAQSRGIYITNGSLNTIKDLEVTSFSDAILPGWDVELYRNGVLIDQELNVMDGRYEFDDVPLNYGQNSFEIIQYGPQGQVISNTYEKLIDSSTSLDKEWTYDLSLVDLGETLFSQSTIAEPEYTGYALTGEYSKGISRDFGFRFGHSTIFGDDSLNILSVGGNYRAGDSVLLGFDLSGDTDDEFRFDINARTAIGKHAIRLAYQAYQQKPDTILDNTLSHRLSLLNNGPLVSSKSFRASYQNVLSATDNGLGTKIYDLKNSIGLNFLGMSANHSLNYSKVESANNAVDTLTGTLAMQRNIGPVFARVQALYDATESFEPTNYSGQFSMNIGESMRTKLTLDHSVISDIDRATLDFDWSKRQFNLATRVSYDSNENWFASLFARFSIGAVPTALDTFNSNRSLANSGSFVIRIFEDQNANLRYDPGEPLLEGVKVDSVQSRSNAVSNINGLATLTSLQDQKTTDIIIKQDSLPDPFMIPAIEGISITPRAGFIDSIDYPILHGSEVDGSLTILTADGDDIVGKYIDLELVNSYGRVVKKTKTEFDGYFLFTALKPGKYKLRVAEESIESNNLYDVSNKTIDLKNGGMVVSDVQMSLQQKKKTTGYLVSLGQFTKSEFLHAYALLVTRKYKTRYFEKVAPFIVEKDNKQTLALAYLPNIELAQSECKKAQMLGINCEVSAFNSYK